MKCKTEVQSRLYDVSQIHADGALRGASMLCLYPGYPDATDTQDAAPYLNPTGTPRTLHLCS